MVPPVSHRIVRIAQSLASIAQSLASILLYCMVAVVTTWPLVPNLQSRLVVGTEVAKTVPMFNAWTIWWNADRALHGFHEYWDAPIFYPTTNAFAFSEPQPMTLLVAPLVWGGSGPIVAANVYLLLSLVLNGFFAERFLRSLGCLPLIAIGGGVAMELLPVVHWQIGVLQLVPLWAMLWVFWTLLRMARLGTQAMPERAVLEMEPTSDRPRPSGTDDRPRSSGTHDGYPRSVFSRANFIGLRKTMALGAEFGVACAAAMMTCVHHALFLGLLLCVALPFLGRGWLRLSTWSMMGFAAVIFLVLCGPMLWHLKEMTQQGDFTRPRDTVGQLSLLWNDYASVYGRTWVEANDRWGRPYWFMNPGWLKTIFAISGLAFGLWAGCGCLTGWGCWHGWGLLRAIRGFWNQDSAEMKSPESISPEGLEPSAIIVLDDPQRTASEEKQRRDLWEPGQQRVWAIWTRLGGVALLAAFLFSLGPHLQIGDWQPWWLVADWVPGFAQVRNVFRFGYFFQILIVLFAAQGVHAWGVSCQWAQRKWFQIPLILLATWAALDPWPPTLALAEAPDLNQHQDWVQFLQNEQIPGNPKFENSAFCIPVAPANDVRDFEVTTQWMLIASGHGKWLVNGYSGFFPAGYFSLRDEFLRDGFTNNFVERLRAQRVRYLVIDRNRYTLPWEDRWHWDTSEVTRVFRGRAGVDVYRLGP